MFKPSAFSSASKYINHGEITANMMAYSTDYFVSYNNFWDYDTTTKKGAISDNYLRVDAVGKKLDGNDSSVKNIAVL